jgi:4'-phosphopantetheinyl transferase
MPKIWQSYIKKDVLTGLWHITEQEAELRSLLHAFEQEAFSSPRRTSQWLASRILLQEMLAEKELAGPFLLQTELSGKPRLNVEHLEISISHSGKFAAVAVSEKKPVGLDIEKLSPKISRLYPKFMNDAEIKKLKGENDLRQMQLVWSAKESLFKYYGAGGLDFREHLHIDRIYGSYMTGRIEKEALSIKIDIPYKFMEDYVITWAAEQ